MVGSLIFLIYYKTLQHRGIYINLTIIFIKAVFLLNSTKKYLTDPVSVG